jgi:hypothetical protein
MHRVALANVNQCKVAIDGAIQAWAIGFNVLTPDLKLHPHNFSSPHIVIEWIEEILFIMQLELQKRDTHIPITDRIARGFRSSRKNA